MRRNRCEGQFSCRNWLNKCRQIVVNKFNGVLSALNISKADKQVATYFLVIKCEILIFQSPI